MSTRCCSTSPTSTSTASRWSSRPTWCWPCSCARTRSSAEQKARNFAYYEALTVRDSSLSASAQAVVAAETGHLELAYDYLAETALMDIDDLEHNTRDGLHVAALAGAWLVLVQGFGGMRGRGGQLPSFAPRLPPALTRLTFTLCLRGGRLRVEVKPEAASYLLDGDGPPLEIMHHGEPVTVTAGQPVSRPIPAIVSPRHLPSRPGVSRCAVPRPGRGTSRARTRSTGGRGARHRPVPDKAEGRARSRPAPGQSTSRVSCGSAAR